ncbi:DUF166 family protein [Halarsenatibacter silvermanii]|uniref:Thymidylate synthase n=1 Tax=Halarsenatibacter silvermanii TaxID=321763 RepID=A0A1G9H5F7_9FIRM|nr:DUF166 family protein [Halarsenatibacter silvermanii]SDL08069.1 hypothetical protein SAMN04488692_101104 [Halarsenatibacter silvermanii]
MKLTIIYQETNRGWGSRMASFLKKNAPEVWKVKLVEMPVLNLPVIDEPENHLPEEMPGTDLMLALIETGSLGQLVPELSFKSGARAALIPVDFETGMPAGLQRQIKSRLEEQDVAVAMPEPFCSLTPVGYDEKLIRSFAEEFGRPEFEFYCQESRLGKVEVERSSPCGGSHFVAGEITGSELDEASQEAGLAHQYYPCMASVDIIHRSAHVTEAAVKRARKDCLQQSGSEKTTS